MVDMDCEWGVGVGDWTARRGGLYVVDLGLGMRRVGVRMRMVRNGRCGVVSMRYVWIDVFFLFFSRCWDTEV